MNNDSTTVSNAKWLEETWPAGSGQESGTDLLLYGESEYGFFLSVDMMSHARALLIVISDDSVKVPNHLPQAKGFAMNTVSIPLPPPFDGYKSLRLALTENEYSDVFYALAGDVITASSTRKDIQSVIIEAINRVEQWKNLMDKLRAGGLSRENQIGLYGELWFLNNFTRPAWGTAAAIESWFGPEAENQDMQRGSCGIEVKSTARVDPVTLPVSNVKQLDDTTFEDLILYQLGMDRGHGGNDKLPAIVDELRQAARAEGVGNLLELRLLDYGYLNSDREKYTDTSYTVTKQTGFRITDKFPRLIAQDIPNGVQNVRYEVTTAACQDSIIHDNDLRELLNGYQ